ncbi:MAG: 2,3-bisphosphoglycerate-independent phosphoglycerate mutase [Gemmatimonadetes bacterium]|nr:2,3-bisphosphoglycerate-independent phosphoglycerate mutase [Gemmatimonadota bacterium]
MGVVIPDDLVEKGKSRIVLLVMDGLGGLPDPYTGKTELEEAETPNLDALAANAALGLLRPLLPGVTVGSGPGHLALFGYDPLEWNIGRGVLSALGVGFDLQPGDLAVRLNFASRDAEGRITDRRAGRPSDAENRRLVEKLRAGVRSPEGVQVFFEPEKEHRLVLVLRGKGLSAALQDTDPQETGVPPLPVRSLEPGAEATAALVQRILDDATQVLADEPAANALLARGFAEYVPYPSFQERYGLRAVAIARYPMYGGVARLVGMDVLPRPEKDEGVVTALEQSWDAGYDFFFLHFKYTDSRGEDGDFSAKASAIAAVDRLIPRVTALKPDVLIVTGDHSTPSRYRAHSWHPVPVLIASPWTRGRDQEGFGETACLRGELGILESKHLMTLALAHAGRLTKFGA